MNVVSLKDSPQALLRLPGGGVRMTNEEMSSDLTLTSEIRRVRGDDAGRLSIALVEAVGPTRLVFKRREGKNGNSWAGAGCMRRTDARSLGEGLEAGPRTCGPRRRRTGSVQDFL